MNGAESPVSKQAACRRKAAMTHRPICHSLVCCATSAALHGCVLLVLAFAIGKLCGDKGLATGEYVASMIPMEVGSWMVAPILFSVAGAIAFSTGTSWGTFAIMLPIAWKIAEKVGFPPEIAISAVLSGGVFGDHCSPISDTTIVSSMASASDHIDHVRTQLPYALIAGAGAVPLYGIAGALS